HDGVEVAGRQRGDLVARVQAHHQRELGAPRFRDELAPRLEATGHRGQPQAPAGDVGQAHETIGQRRHTISRGARAQPDNNDKHVAARRTNRAGLTTLHIPTLLAALVLGYSLLVLELAIAHSRLRDTELGTWTLGGVALLGGFVMLAARGFVPLALSVV